MPAKPGDAVNLAISLCLTYIICLSCVRIWIRRGAFGTDDVVITVATLVTFGHTAADYAAVSTGLGKTWAGLQEQGQLRALNAATVAGVVTFVIALYLSKCAVLCFLSRIPKTREQLNLYLCCNVAVALSGVVSLLTVTVGCASTSGYYWAASDSSSNRCPSQAARWRVLTALDIVTELVLLVLPVRLVWGLQMARTRKAMIISAFYLRIPVLAFTLLRNDTILSLSNNGANGPTRDPGRAAAIITIWLEVHLAYALAASTLSASKSFAESFNSGFGLGFARSEKRGDGSGSAESGGSGGSGASGGRHGAYALGEVSSPWEATCSHLAAAGRGEAKSEQETTEVEYSALHTASKDMSERENLKSGIGETRRETV